MLTELELWPNLIRLADRQGIPVVIVNGRLGEASFRGYRRIRFLMRHVLQRVSWIGAQTETYAHRFVQLGADPRRVAVTGSVKFDGAETDRHNARTAELARLAHLGPQDMVFLAGSTQDPEERLALETFQQLLPQFPALRLILVPRHPERFDEVARMLDSTGVLWQRRSQLESARRPEARVLLVDTIGELGAWWGVAQVAFVGGSFGDRGGQNMIEPAAYGAAVSFGPNTWNFRDVVQLLCQGDAAQVVRDGADLTRFVRRCLEDEPFRCSLGQRAQQLVRQNQGAAARTCEQLVRRLPVAATLRGTATGDAGRCRDRANRPEPTGGCPRSVHAAARWPCGCWLRRLDATVYSCCLGPSCRATSGPLLDSRGLRRSSPWCVKTPLTRSAVVSKGKFQFTSESVSMGHPDKLADQISDGILDALFAQDPYSRVACETLVTTGIAVVAGEITTRAVVDYQDVVRRTIREVGYVDDQMGICADTCAVMVSIDKQSPDIAQGVDADEDAGKDIGAGDQGLMFGYACNDTEELMPMPIALAHRILARLTEARQQQEVSWLRPDSKSQVTVEYEGNRPVRIGTVVVSTQHDPAVSNDELHRFVKEHIVKPVLPKQLVRGDIVYHINPTGRFVVGGPQGDCGLTGRKIIVDTYGGWGRHGGGAFSGKDPTKVDRSAAYMARHVAKNIVAAGLADRCEVQLAYAIGVSEPVSVYVDTEGTGRVDDNRICEVVREFFPLSPRGIIDSLKLRRPIFRKTASGGHFGRNDPDFTWESTQRAAELADAVLGTKAALR